MSTSRFPNLKEIYRQQAEIKRDAYYSHMVTAGGVFILAAIYIGFTSATQSLAIIVGMVALVAMVVLAVRRHSIEYGIQNFDGVWEAKLDEAVDTEQVRDLYATVERELERGSVPYANVILTENFLIMFSSFGVFVPVQEIASIYIDEFAKHQRPGDIDLFPSEMIYKMGIILNSKARYHLSDDQSEIRELMLEIRQRHPDVGFTKQAHAYFFPTPVHIS